MSKKNLSVSPYEYNYFFSFSLTHSWNEVITELREHSDCTQSYIANRLGINRRTYANYEAGISDMKVETINKIAQLYQIPSSIILGEQTILKLWRDTYDKI